MGPQAVLQRGGAGDGDPGALRLGGPEPRDRDLPLHPDGGRGAAHGVLPPLVAGTEARDLGTLLEEVRPRVNEGYNTLFYDRLPSVAQRMATNPSDLDAFIEGVTIYHIVVEATLALTGQRFELESMRELGQTHFGFYQGFTAVARDESRHVNFGIKVLQEAVREDPARFAPLIQRTLVECLPLISGTLDAPDERYYTEYGRSEDEVLAYAMTSLNKRLQAIGINLAA
jgi:ribonucleoside-diphosphate reductase beta chain